jgi:hypothetical protein
MTSHPVWQWGSRQHATAVRTVVLCIWLIIVAITPYGYYGRFPDGMIAGYGLGRLLLGGHALRSFFFSYPVLMVLKWGAIAGCALAILLPNRCRWLTPVVLVFIVVLDQLTKSLNGFINHGQLAPLFVLLVFAVFGGKHYLPYLGFGPDGNASGEQEPTAPSPGGATECPYVPVVWLAGLMIIVPYTFIAINRFFQGGAELFQGDALLDYINLTSRRYSVYGSSVFLELIKVPWLAAALKGGYLVTTVFELCSAGVLFSRMFRRIWLLVIIPFHFVTLFAMNIFFWENVLLILVMFGWGIWLRDGSPAAGRYKSNRSSAPM